LCASRAGSFRPNKPQSTLLWSPASRANPRAPDYCEFLGRTHATSPDVAVWSTRPGESVFHTVCLHLENDIPVQLGRHVNRARVPNSRTGFPVIPPSEYLVRNVLDQIEHVVDAVLPTPEQAERLDMPVTDPCLLLTRRTWTRTTPVTMVRCLHPASRYRLGSRFRADGNPSFG
jgi:GntR family histidine utilization transcriptional repressor